MDILERIKAIIKSEENILFAYIFGSYAKGEQNNNSDIDIALYLKEDSFDYYLDIVKNYKAQPIKR